MNKNLTLQRARNVQLQIDSSNQVIATKGDRKVSCGTRAFAILDAFSEAKTVAEVLQELPVSGAQDWANLSVTIRSLVAAQVLEPIDADAPTLAQKEGGFDTAGIHIDMLNDTARTRAYIAAIKAVVKPGDVVLDLGTGTGILATAAAKAGAKHVYAIEASAIADVAAQVFIDNNVADRVTLVRGWSMEVGLPERVDVIVSELIGDNALGERVREISSDAVTRFAKPHARLIPSALTINATALTVNETIRSQHIGADFQVDYWDSLYDIDLSSFVKASRAQPALRYTLPQTACEWPTMAPPCVMAEVDLAVPSLQTALDRRARVPAHNDCKVDGILLTFDLTLSDSIHLSTDLPTVASDNHWFSPLWIQPHVLEVTAGTTVEFHYTRNDSQERCSAKVVSA